MHTSGNWEKRTQLPLSLPLPCCVCQCMCSDLGVYACAHACVCVCPSLSQLLRGPLAAAMRRRRTST